MIDQATALALLGERKAALAALHKAVDSGYFDTWEFLELDPAFDAIRGDGEFQTMMRAIKAKMALERQNLDRLRSSGRIPNRGGGATPARALPNGAVQTP